MYSFSRLRSTRQRISLIGLSDEERQVISKYFLRLKLQLYFKRGHFVQPLRNSFTMTSDPYSVGRNTCTIDTKPYTNLMVGDECHIAIDYSKNDGGANHLGYWGKGGGFNPSYGYCNPVVVSMSGDDVLLAQTYGKSATDILEARHPVPNLVCL